MSKTLIVLLLTASITRINGVYGQISIHRPKFLVENQPMFKNFTFENAIPFQKEKLLGISYQHSYHRLQGFPIPVINKEKILMSLGVGFASDQYDNQRPQLIESTHDVIWFQFFNTGDLGENYF